MEPFAWREVPRRGVGPPVLCCVEAPARCVPCGPGTEAQDQRGAGDVRVLEGHPFIVEAAVSLGGRDIRPGINVYRFANRIPLLFEVTRA